MGKTSLIKQHTQGTFSLKTPSTTGAVYSTKNITVDDEKYSLQIWDTAGQSVYRNIASIYFRDAHGILLIYDVTNRKSFEDLSFWFNEIYSKCEQSVAILVLGNKEDMSTKVITFAEASEMAASHKCHHMFVSASTGKNIEDSFSDLVRSVVNSDIRREVNKKQKNSTAIRKKPLKEKKGCSC